MNINGQIENLVNGIYEMGSRYEELQDELYELTRTRLILNAELRSYEKEAQKFEKLGSEWERLQGVLFDACDEVEEAADKISDRIYDVEAVIDDIENSMSAIDDHLLKTYQLDPATA